MAHVQGFALIDGKRIELKADGDDATVHNAMADFFGRIGAAVAQSATVTVTPTTKPRRRRTQEAK